MIWLTLRETPYFPSQSKLIRTSSGVNGNKIESFCGKYNSKYRKFDLVKVPMWKIRWCSSHFFKKNLCSFTMAFTLDHVKNFLKGNSVLELRNAESVICDRLKKSPWVTPTKLYESLSVTKTVKREILVEQDWPNPIENAVALRYVCLSCLFFLINKLGYNLTSLVYKRKVHWPQTFCQGT